MNFRKNLSIGLACFGLGAAYLTKDCQYHSELANEEYKQEFKQEADAYRRRIINRVFPSKAKTADIIDIGIVVDAEFKKAYEHWMLPDRECDWQKELEKSLENMSGRFHDEFGLAFEIKEFMTWDTKDERNIRALKSPIMRTGIDSFGVIGLTGKKQEGTVMGIASTPSGQFINPQEYSVMTAAGESWNITIGDVSLPNLNLEKIMQHELSHWLGATDSVFQKMSIMDYEAIAITNKWDEENKTLMRERIQLILGMQKQRKGLKTKQNYIKAWLIPSER